MDENSEYWANLRQEISRYRAGNQKIKGEARLVPDPLWIEACEEFDRLRRSGLKEEEAAQVFRVFLNDPERRDAAALLLECYSSPSKFDEAATTEESSG